MGLTKAEKLETVRRFAAESRPRVSFGIRTKTKYFVRDKDSKLVERGESL